MNAERKIRVVLVDDVPELRLLVRITLEEDPAIEVVGEAANGRDGVEVVEATDPDLVLLDLSMPDMDGLEAIPEIRNLQPDVTIIVLSGFSADRMANAAEERGADGYVEKGTPISELREITRKAVALRAA